MKSPKNRPSIFEVLKMPDTGASPKGSTYRKSLMMCPHEHGMIYELGLRPSNPSEALTIGLVFHYALQRFYEEIFRWQREFEQKYPQKFRREDAYYWGNQSEAAAVAWNAVRDLETAEGYKETWEVIQRVLNQYLDHYSFRDRWRILAIEEKVEYYGEHAGYFDNTARLDLLIEDVGSERVFNVEHKSARYISEDLIDFYDLDDQILGQTWLGMKCIDWGAMGLPMYGGNKINIASKQKTPVLVRHDALPSEQALRAFEISLGERTRLREAYKALGWPKFFGHCAGFTRGYSKCQFYEVCRGFPLETVESLKRWRDPPLGFERRDPNSPTIEDYNV